MQQAHALISFSFFSFYIFISLAPFLLIPCKGLILSDCKNRAIKENYNLRVLQRTLKVNIKVCGSGTHMVAPEAFKPYVGGNSNRCGTCDYNYKV